MFPIISDGELSRYLDEDLPYGDLTTHLLGIGARSGEIVFRTRNETTVCCSEEAARMFALCGAKVVSLVPSGSRLPAGGEILTVRGAARSLHSGWKVALNLLEYASGIASRTSRIVAAATKANPAVRVVGTRKSFPGTRKVAIKAIASGGALPHRLGLSDSVLVFRQHTVFCGGLEQVLRGVPALRAQAPEQKIAIEAETAAEALAIVRAGVDMVQIDKMTALELQPLVEALRVIDASVKIAAAGGIDETNAADYAATGVDMLVLSSVYFGKPADIAVTMTPAGEIALTEEI